jgi:hypothetical protein
MQYVRVRTKPNRFADYALGGRIERLGKFWLIKGQTEHATLPHLEISVYYAHGHSFFTILTNNHIRQALELKK